MVSACFEFMRALNRTDGPTLRWSRAIVLFLFALSALGNTAIAASSASSTDSLLVVPVEARSLAHAILEGTWEKIARNNPSFLRIPFGVDVEDATLGEPFLVFKLASPGLEKYVDSAEHDPRGFATVVEYCFPILLPDHRDAGAVIIVRNRNDVGEKFIPSDGEVSASGFYGPDDVTLSMIGTLRRYYRSPCAVEYVDIAEHQFLVRDGKGNLLAGQDQSSLKPIVEDAAGIREKIRRFRESIPMKGEK